MGIRNGGGTVNEFVASNGVKVTPGKEHGQPILMVDDRISLWNIETVKALREFFQHERDEELGRWRWPEKPEWVVYAKRPGFSAHNGADLLVINEAYGESMEYSRALDDGTEYVEQDERAALAARAYFEAHPERKPWEDAKTGEAWVLHVPAGPVVAVRRFDGNFYDYEGNQLVMKRVSDARRIWPEDAS